MQAAQAIRAERGADAGAGQSDMFGLDDSAIKEAEQMGRVAARKKREATAGRIADMVEYALDVIEEQMNYKYARSIKLRAALPCCCCPG